MRNELAQYNPDLLDKQHILTISKSDLLDDELERELRAELAQRLDTPPLFFSSVAHQGLASLKDAVWQAIMRANPLLDESRYDR